MKYLFSTLILVLFCFASPLSAQNRSTGQTTQKAEQTFSIDVKNMDIRDVIRLISKGYSLNIVLDRKVTGKVTLNLIDVPVSEGLKVLVESYGWELEQRGDVYHIGIAKEKGNLELVVQGDLVTADLVNVEINRFIRDFSEKTGVSVVPASKLTGRISAKLYKIPTKDALKTVLEGNGFSVELNRNIYTISRGESGNEGGRNNSRGRRRFNIDFENDALSIEVQNGDLDALIHEIANVSELEIVVYGKLSGQVNARLNKIPLDEGLALILGGTKYTFVNRGDIILIGDRNGATPAGQTLTTSKLIHLFHIKADEVPKILPKNIPATAIKVVKEQNALLISGTSEDIVKTQQFLRSIDIPTPQVALDVLIVEYTREIGKDFGFEVSGNRPATGDNAKRSSNYYSFPYVEMNRTGDQAKELLKSVFGNKTFITNLPDDFMMTLKLLEDQKRAKVLAQPTLTVLNGNKAKIDVGETSYFKVIGGTADSPTQNFRPINSGITVNITPWISKSGQITAEVNPEISNATTVNEDGYPNISRRSINTTVRIEDNKTVVLGGLLKSTESISHQQVPFLGDIPILGYLFKSTNRRQVQSNLVIYITPHIIEGHDFVNLPQQLKSLNEINSKVWLKDLESTIIENYEAEVNKEDPKERVKEVIPVDSSAVQTLSEIDSTVTTQALQTVN